MMAIDFQKAFDSTAFSFKKAALQFVKFCKNLIDWIMILLEYFIVKLVQAGNISKKIFIERGCRQGDPTERLLFILCIEILLIKIRTADTVKPFKLTFKLNPFREETVKKKIHGWLCRRHKTQHQKLYWKPAGSYKHYRKLWKLTHLATVLP